MFLHPPIAVPLTTFHVNGHESTDENENEVVVFGNYALADQKITLEVQKWELLVLQRRDDPLFTKRNVDLIVTTLLDRWIY